MEKYYFLEVQTYKSVNNMGLELGNYVEEKYHNTVVSSRDLIDIRDDIRAKMDELETRFPRSRPFKLNMSEHRDRYGVEHEDISVKPDSQYNDNYVFCMTSTVIRNAVMEVRRVV